MTFGIAFATLVPLYVLWGAIAAAILVATLLIFTRNRGALVRPWQRSCEVVPACEETREHDEQQRTRREQA